MGGKQIGRSYCEVCWQVIAQPDQAYRHVGNDYYSSAPDCEQCRVCIRMGKASTGKLLQFKIWQMGPDYRCACRPRNELFDIASMRITVSDFSGEYCVAVPIFNDRARKYYFDVI